MNVKVVVRVRPPLPSDNKQASIRQREGQGRQGRKRSPRPSVLRSCALCATCSSNTTLNIRHTNPKNGDATIKEFVFDRVTDHRVTQSEFFLASGVQALISSTLDGYAACVFAYGQTGSGKTYTMSGMEVNKEKLLHQRNVLIPRSLSYLCAKVIAKRKQGFDIAISASYAEIYNEQVFDLLNNLNEALPLRFQHGVGFFIEKQVVVECQNFEDLRAVATEGHKNRTVRSHALNLASSRSHSIFTVYVDVFDRDKDSTIRGKISFIDLAGSENVKYSHAEGVTLKETNNINKSLFTLGKVISSLSAKHRRRASESTHVPYRDSILTKLLMDTLGGGGLAMMLACCSPAQLHVDETLRTLLYATRARNIRNKPIRSIHINAQHELKKLRNEVRVLRKENEDLRRLLTSNKIEIPSDRSTDRISSKASLTEEKKDIYSSAHLPERSREMTFPLQKRLGSFSVREGNPTPDHRSWWDYALETSGRGLVGSRTSNTSANSISNGSIPGNNVTNGDTSNVWMGMGFQEESNEGKKLSISQERFAHRLERRSSRRPKANSNEFGEITPQTQAELRLLRENILLKKRLDHLESVFIKGSIRTSVSSSPVTAGECRKEGKGWVGSSAYMPSSVPPTRGSSTRTRNSSPGKFVTVSSAGFKRLSLTDE
ncbi:hypothetical protein AAMO2058_000736800 [Amorphochlora amoebiformis]